MCALNWIKSQFLGRPDLDFFKSFLKFTKHVTRDLQAFVCHFSSKIIVRNHMDLCILVRVIFRNSRLKWKAECVRCGELLSKRNLPKNLRSNFSFSKWPNKTYILWLKKGYVDLYESKTRGVPQTVSQVGNFRMCCNLFNEVNGCWY